jgi:hypothetical protein
MDPKYLNTRSEFTVGDRVNVTDDTSGICHPGIIAFVQQGPVNRALLRGDLTDYIYVKFENTIIFSSFFRQGSSVRILRKYKSINNCVIRTINYEQQTMVVAIDDGGYMIHPPEFSVSFDDIDSILIWRVAYTIEKYS